jgi:hypothetical protein
MFSELQLTAEREISGIGGLRRGITDTDITVGIKDSRR